MIATDVLTAIECVGYLVGIVAVIVGAATLWRDR